MNQNRKNMVWYTIMMLLFVIAFWGLYSIGNLRYDAVESISTIKQMSSLDPFLKSLLHEFSSPLTLMLCQIILILLVSRLFGLLFVRIGQPMVMGEIIAGVALGPSLLGNYCPEFYQFLFAPENLVGIDALSKIGLILFMFVIGMELDLSVLRNKLNQTTLISHASIVFPFLLGMILSYYIYDLYPDKNASFIEFALFVGVSMSITAFPVLARILQERNQIKTRMGGLAIASAANGDLTAWCLLAVVIAIAKAGSVTSSLYTIALSILYVLFMFIVVRPFMVRLGHIYHRKEVMTKSFIAFIFTLLIISSTITQIIGIHALFGAFVAGVVMSPNLRFRKVMTEKIEDIALVLLLPLFFVFTGIKTKIGLLNTPEHWEMFGIITLVAIVGKLGGAAIAARLSGESWRSSLSVGTLMNSRGLMELIVLDIGYEMKILPPEVFVMLVLMALVTTLMTSPLLSFIDFVNERRKRKIPQEEESSREMQILISFGQPKSGERLFHLAEMISRHHPQGRSIAALHLTHGTDVNPLHVEEFAKESFAPINQLSDTLNVPYEPVYKVTNDITSEILETVEERSPKLLLLGAGVNLLETQRKESSQIEQTSVLRRVLQSNVRRFTPSDLFLDKTEALSTNSSSDVGIYIYRGLQKLDKVVIVTATPNDIFLLNYGQMLLTSKPNIHIQVLMSGQYSGIDIDQIRRFVDANHEQVVKVNTSVITPVIYSGWDLIIFSLEGWGIVRNEANHNLTKLPSTLLIKNNTYKPKEE